MPVALEFPTKLTPEKIGDQIETSAQANQSSNEQPQNLKLIAPHTEPARTNSDHESVDELDESPLRTPGKQLTRSYQQRRKMYLKRSENHSRNDHDEENVPTPIMNKVLETMVPHIWNFLTHLRIAMRATSQEQVDEINAHLNVLPDPGELKDFVN